MGRNNVRLINYHTTGTTAPKITDMKAGEIAVGKDLIWSKHNENDNEKLSVFISSGAVHSAISAATTEIKGITDGLSAKITENTQKFNNYATSANTVAADTKTLKDAKDYTNLLKAKEGETYGGETLAGLKSEINSLKGDSDTSVGAVASRVTAIEVILGKTNEDGLRKDVADLKTTVGDSTTGLVRDVADLKTKDTDLNTKIDAVSGASSAYTDSQINAIKGGDGTTTETISSLNSKIEKNSSAISGITNGTRLDSFKDVEDEINSKISSVYKVRGTKETYAKLPTEGNTIGDVYNVIDANGNTPAGTNYVCTATTGSREEQWDALGGTVDLSTYATETYVNNVLSGVTGTGKDSIVTRLNTAENDITNLKKSASTLNTDVQTIKGWKINDKFISGSPSLNGTDIKVDNTEGAQTLKEAITSAKTAGDSAMDYAKGVSGSVKNLKDTVYSNKSTIDAYTVNGINISENPVLTGENVLVGGTSEDKDKTLNTTIAEAKAAGTAASDAVNTLRGGYEGTIKSINDSVSANTSNIYQLRTDVNDISIKANSAIHRITIKANANAGVTISDPMGNDGEKTQELDFSEIVIDCGTF